MRVLYFGYYNPNYARNRILIRGLEQNGVEVLQCQDSSRGLRKFFKLYAKHKEFKGKYDCIVIGFMGHLAVPLAKLISSKPVIFDAFVSLYEANVSDRKLVNRFSIKAVYYWLLDWLSMKIANVVLFDTNEHVNYVSKKFKIRKDKFRRIFVGAQDDVFIPMPEKVNEKFTVFFYGSYIPLQGIEYIVKAAKMLEEREDIDFRVLGGGQESERISELAKKLDVSNVEFVPRVSIHQLAKEISAADICLGIFGDTEKTQRVIPNKVYECLFMKKPVITSDTPAIRELFGDTDLLLIKSASPEALAQALIKLKNDPILRGSLAQNGYEKVNSLANAKVLGGELRQICEFVSQPV